MKNSIEITKKYWGNLQKTFGLGRVLLCLALIIITFNFSACSTVFANNPVVKDIKDGNVELDLEMFDNKMFTGKGEQTSTEPSFTTEEIAFFTDFIDKVQSFSSVAYTRAFFYSDTPPAAVNDVDELLTSTNLQVIEHGESVKMTDSELNQELIYDGTSAAMRTIGDENWQSVKFGNKEQRHDLKYLAKEARLEVFSITKETVDGIDYQIVNLNENSQVSKWYFDLEGNLSLRMFVEEEKVYAIRYSGITFDILVEPSVFNIKDATSLEDSLSLPVEQPLVVTEKAKQPEQISANENTKPEQLPKIEATEEDQMATSQPKEDTVVTDGVKEIESEQPKLLTQEKAVSVENKDKVVPGVKAEITKENKEPPIGTVVPGANKEEKQFKPGDTSKITEYTEAQQIAASSPSNIESYPTNVLPIMSNMDITNTQDKEKNGIRKIEVSGNYKNSSAGALDYYENILEKSPNYSKEENIDESTGDVSYSLHGKVDGWNIYIKIDEKDQSQTKTMYIKLEK